MDRRVDRRGYLREASRGIALMAGLAIAVMVSGAVIAGILTLVVD